MDAAPALSPAPAPAAAAMGTMPHISPSGGDGSGGASLAGLLAATMSPTDFSPVALAGAVHPPAAGSGGGGSSDISSGGGGGGAGGGGSGGGGGGSGFTSSPAPVVAAHRTIARFMPTKICVFGSGSFGTAMGTVLARNGHEVWILTRRKEVAAKITKEHINPSAFSDMILPFNIAATTDAARALDGAAYILHAIPVQASFDYLRELKDLIPPTVPIMNTSKGLHTEKLILMSDLIPQALGREQPFACLSGPTFAQELMKGFPSGAVVASTSDDVASQVASLFSGPNFKVWRSPDVVGVELAGALKNVYAIASGVLEGLGLGLNTTAMLCTRAIAEMNGLAIALGGNPATLAGLSGVGDMVLTCFGKLSRNRSVGVRLGSGESLADVMASMTEVAEGVATAPAALRLARQHKIPTPIVEAVVAVLDGTLSSPLPALMALLALPVGEESHRAFT